MKIRGQRLVYPWDIKRTADGTVTGFSGSVGDFDSVIWNLQRLGYPFREYAQLKDGLQGAAGKAVSKVFEILSGCYDEAGKPTRLPWLLVASESNDVLHSIEKVVPIAWSLSTRHSCFNATSAYLVDLYGTKRPSDDFEPDPAGDVMEEVKRSGLLVWEDVLSFPDGIWRQAGRMYGLLKHKFVKKSALLVTAFTPNGFDKAKVNDEIKKRYGDQIAGLLSYAIKSHFASAPSIPDWGKTTL